MEEKILTLLALLKPVDSIVVYDLPSEYLDADFLAVAWADPDGNLIDVGMRDSATVGGVLEISDKITWTTARAMRDPASWQRLFDRKVSNPKLWPHVRISAAGRLWLARKTPNKPAPSKANKPKPGKKQIADASALIKLRDEHKLDYEAIAIKKRLASAGAAKTAVSRARAVLKRVTK